MYVNRRGSSLQMELGETEIRGLYALLSGTPNAVSPEELAQGQWLYNWFFSSVQKLATNFHQESSIATQSNDSSPEVPSTETSAPTTRRGRKR